MSRPTKTASPFKTPLVILDARSNSHHVAAFLHGFSRQHGRTSLPDPALNLPDRAWPARIGDVEAFIASERRYPRLGTVRIDARPGRTGLLLLVAPDLTYAAVRTWADGNAAVFPFMGRLGQTIHHRNGTRLEILAGSVLDPDVAGADAAPGSPGQNATKDYRRRLAREVDAQIDHLCNTGFPPDFFGPVMPDIDAWQQDMTETITALLLATCYDLEHSPIRLNFTLSGVLQHQDGFSIPTVNIDDIYHAARDPEKVRVAFSALARRIRDLVLEHPPGGAVSGLLNPHWTEGWSVSLEPETILDVRLGRGTEVSGHTRMQAVARLSALNPAFLNLLEPAD